MKKRATHKNEFSKATARFWMKTLKFTEKVITWVTILYIINWVTSAAIIIWAIRETQNFAYLDTLITETSETFRSVVGVAIIKFGVENVFKYNDFGGRIPSRPEENNENSVEYNEEAKG